MVSARKNKIFKNISLSNSNNGFKENVNEKISCLLKRKSVVRDRNKRFF